MTDLFGHKKTDGYDYSMDAYYEETRQFLLVFHAYVEEQYGVRCDETVSGCACCDAWKLYDEANSMFLE